MSRRRRSDLWDDFFEVMQRVFKHTHPAWSIPIAACFLFGPVLWIKYKIPQAQNFFYWLGLILGGMPACLTLAAGVAGWRYRRNRAAFVHQHLDIDWLNTLTWQEFEAQVAEMYRHQGYRVDEIGGGGADGGIDLCLQRDGMTAIVQCKRWKTYKVGVKPIREVYGVLAGESANRAIFITSGVYTDEALRFAQGKPLELIDGAQLALMFRRYQLALNKSLNPASGGSAPEPEPVTTAPARPTCPRCGSEMVLRRAKKGAHGGQEFWGCSTYSKTGCGGIREVDYPEPTNKPLAKPITLCLLFAVLPMAICQAQLPSLEQTRVAAEKGDPAAEHNLASGYLGQGDFATAFEWFQKAANQGDADSYWQLAKLFNQGKPKSALSHAPIPKDTDETLRCVLIAASLGHETAQLDLARRYEGGNGLNRDIVEAYKWYKLTSRKAPSIGEAMYINHLVLGMTHEEIQEGEKRAKDWKPHQTTDKELLQAIYLQKIVLKGFVESSGRRMAIINGRPLAKGDQATIKVGQKTIPIRCLELKQKSAVLQIEGITQPQEVSLR